MADSLRRATSRATLVLPTPPGPTMVTRRSAASSRCREATARSRPIRRAGGGGVTFGAAGGGPAAPPAISRSRAGECRGRIEPGLVRETPPIVTSDAHRLRGLRGRGQGPHLQQHGRLTQRVGRDGRRGQAQHVAGLAGRDRAADQGVDDLFVQLRPALGGGGERQHVGQIRQHRSAPEGVRLPQEGNGAHGIAIGGSARFAEQAPRLRHVQLLGFEGQSIAVRARFQSAHRRSEVAPQAETRGSAGQRGPSRAPPTATVRRPDRPPAPYDHRRWPAAPAPLGASDPVRQPSRRRRPTAAARALPP